MGITELKFCKKVNVKRTILESIFPVPLNSYLIENTAKYSQFMIIRT